MLQLLIALASACALFTSMPGVPRLAAAQEEDPELLLIDKAGQATSLGLRGLSLDDPRSKGAWSVRPLGFEPLEFTAPVEGRPRLLVGLANGDQLQGELVSSEGETLGLQLLGGVQLTLAIDHITRIDLAVGARQPRADPLAQPSEGDRLYRRTEGDELDAIDGTFDSFVEGGVQFESSALGLKRFDWAEVATLFIEDLGAATDQDQAQGLNVILDLQGNSRLRGQLLSLVESGCQLRVASEELLLPWGVVQELLVDDGSLVFLSDLAAEEEQGQGQVFGDEFEVVWPHAPNLCVGRATPLRSGGRVFRRGIGTHAPTRVSWRVPEGTRFLRGLVGIDDSALYNEPEYRGSVIFRVFVGEQLAWESPLLSGGAQPLVMPAIDLSQAQRVTLEADPAGGYEGDRANWLDLAFVR